MLSTIMSLLPTVFEFIEYLIGLKDEEFEKISAAWPLPIKLKMARVRSELKAQQHFFGG